MKPLGDRHELVMLINNVEASVYDGRKTSCVKMLEVMQAEHPGRAFRIDRLIREKGEVISPKGKAG